MLFETTNDLELANLARFFGAGFTAADGLRHCVKLAQAIKQVIEADHTIMIVPEDIGIHVHNLGGREFDVWVHNEEPVAA